MAMFHWLTAEPWEIMREKVKKIKNESGVQCTDLSTRDLVETETGKIVLTFWDVTFEGNIFQVAKANRMIKDGKPDDCVLETMIES